MRGLLALLSGGTLALAFAPLEWTPAVWLWPLPLWWLLWTTDSLSKRKTLLLGWLAGAAWALPAFQWVRHSSRVLAGAVDNSWAGLGAEAMGAAALLALGLYLACYVAVWSLFLSTVAKPRTKVLQQGAWWEASLESLRCAFLAASSWVALEVLRAWLFTGLSWNGLGAGLVQHAALIQVADVVGAAGLAFTPVFCMAVVFLTVWRMILQKRTGRVLRWHFDVAVAAGLIAAQLAYGIQKLAQEPSSPLPLKIALVQLNIPQAERWAAAPEQTMGYYQRHDELTQLYTKPLDGSSKSPVDLVVWPESALVPFYEPYHVEYFNRLMAVSDFSLLAGTDVMEPEGDSFVSAALFHKGWPEAKLYHKRHLVPFGEYLPLRSLPGMQAVFGGLFPGDFQHGPADQQPLPLANVPGVELLPLVCFEDTVARVARKGIRSAPQLLVNLTNDGWFLHSAEPRAHLLNAALRCVELRRPMVRACNTGVSCLITDKGEITQMLRGEDGSTFVQGVQPVTAVLDKTAPVTFYAAWGDAFGISLALLSLAAALVHHRRHQA
jgi:apolipoprotein N-acyltransferase